MQARLGLGDVTARTEEARRRAGALDAEADDVERRLTEREARRRARLAGIARCTELHRVALAATERAEASVGLAATERDTLDEARAVHQRTLGVLRDRLRAVEEERAALVGAAHGDELRGAERRHALRVLRTRLADELGVDPDATLAAARAVDAEDPDAPLHGGDELDTALAEQEAGLVRKIGLIGAVNPLAVDEHARLVERQAFLAGQLDDLRSSRRDLEHVVAAVDERIEEVFAAAFADVDRHFRALFADLFPGGEGRLVLTVPDDLLTSGVEVEARPPGKRVKRLSLLSGGERALTAVAVLFAIFKARPSPFYVLDEVEAALDDVNLTRFLRVLRSFADEAQLLVVTHQKRTMEVADTLYGVSMRADGVTRVVSQRLDEVAERLDRTG